MNNLDSQIVIITIMQVINLFQFGLYVSSFPSPKKQRNLSDILATEIKAVSFSMNVVKSFRDPLTRQINEAVRIFNCSATTQLNSKTEWHGPATVRLVAEGGGWGWLRGWQIFVWEKNVWILNNDYE